MSVAEGAVALWTIVAGHASKRSAASIVATIESVPHAHSRLAARTRTAKVTSMIPTSSAIHSPTMSTSVRYIELWTTEEEIVTMWVASVDAKVPVTSVPVERTIEIGGIHE